MNRCMVWLTVHRELRKVDWTWLEQSTTSQPTDRSRQEPSTHITTAPSLFFSSNKKIQPKQQSNNVVDDEEDRKNLRSLYYIPYNTANYLSEREHLADDTNGIKVHFLTQRYALFNNIFLRIAFCVFSHGCLYACATIIYI